VSKREWLAEFIGNALASLIDGPPVLGLALLVVCVFLLMWLFVWRRRKSQKSKPATPIFKPGH